jgi:hypothetical protein
MLTVPKFHEVIFNFFEKHVPQQEKQSQFVQRNSKLNALAFVKAMVSTCLSESRITLQGICGLLSQHKVEIKKQSLFERMNERGVAFFKGLFSVSLKEFAPKCSNFSEILSSFSHVYIIDSSTISLPATLKERFKGCGGNASEAAAKVQVLYDYLEGQIKALTLTPGYQNDQGFECYFTQIKAKALYLMDLGYFKLATFQKIIAGRAYFVSRYFMGAKLLTLDGQEFDLVQQLPQYKPSSYSQEVLLGTDAKIKVRLIAQHLPDDVVAQRIRKLKRAYQRRGLTLSAAKKKLAHWNIYIAHLPSQNQWDESQIQALYTLRWQIELLFKLSKSGMGIDVIYSKKPARVLIELYSKLICLVILLYFCGHASALSGHQISHSKAYKHFFFNAFDFISSLSSKIRMKQFSLRFINTLNLFAIKETKQKKGFQNSAEIDF